MAPATASAGAMAGQAERTEVGVVKAAVVLAVTAAAVTAATAAVAQAARMLPRLALVEVGLGATVAAAAVALIQAARMLPGWALVVAVAPGLRATVVAEAAALRMDMALGE